MCNVKGVSHSDEPTENYRSTLQFFIVFQLIVLVRTECNFKFLFGLTALTIVVFSCNRQLF